MKAAPIPKKIATRSRPIPVGHSEIATTPVAKTTTIPMTFVRRLERVLPYGYSFEGLVNCAAAAR